LWIPITIAAAVAQTLRNATQRHLSTDLGTLGATLVRFLYGLPFAALWVLAVALIGKYQLPAISYSFAGWMALGALSQIAGTALLLRAMREQNFTLGVAYSKSEVMQVAVFGFVFLGDPLASTTVAAVGLGTLGVILLSPVDRQRPMRTLVRGMTTPPALLGLASGGGFALSAVGYRGAALALDTSFLMAAAFTLLGAQLLQTMVMCFFLRGMADFASCRNQRRRGVGRLVHGHGDRTGGSCAHTGSNRIGIQLRGFPTHIQGAICQASDRWPRRAGCRTNHRHTRSAPGLDD
jgi:uncharacterized membrane protein